jgi:hypothetical protein
VVPLGNGAVWLAGGTAMLTGFPRLVTVVVMVSDSAV